jgi:hypothetical protein
MNKDFFIVMLRGSTLWHLQKFLQYIKIYHTWIHHLYHSPFSLPPVPGIVSTGIIFPFTVYTVFAPYSPSHALSSSLPPFHWYQPPLGRTCSALLWIKIYVKEKIWWKSGENGNYLGTLNHYHINKHFQLFYTKFLQNVIFLLFFTPNYCFYIRRTKAYD